MTSGARFVRDVPFKPGYDWLTISKQLKEHPGEWAIIDGDIGVSTTVQAASGRVRYIRSGKSPAMPKGEFEANSRYGVIYARYVGSANEKG